jgi:hypothetical protein
MKHSQDILKNNRQQAIKANEGMHIILQIQKAGILLCAIKAYNNEIAWTTFYDHQDGGADGRSVMAIIKDCKPLNTKSCIVGIDENRFMLLPNSYKDDDVTKAAFEYVHHIEHNEILEHQYLAWQDYFGASLIKNGTKHVFSDWDATILFANTPISLLTIYQQYLIADAHQIFINCNENNIVLTLFKYGKLHLHQAYDMHSPDDVLYHIQNTMNKHSASQPQIYCNGLHSQAMINHIQQHFANAQMQTLPTGFIYPANIPANQLTFLIPILSIAKYANH